jgi:hypothetical protein
MTFKQRLKFYLFGFALGLAVLAIILNKKGGCAGGSLSERKMNELLTQTWKINDKIQCKLNCIGLKNDTLFKAALKTCHVNYDKSEPRAEPCGTYIIESPPGKLAFTLLVQDCKTVSEVLDMTTTMSCDCK